MSRPNVRRTISPAMITMKNRRTLPPSWSSVSIRFLSSTADSSWAVPSVASRSIRALTMPWTNSSAAARTSATARIRRIGRIRSSERTQAPGRLGKSGIAGSVADRQGGRGSVGVGSVAADLCRGRGGFARRRARPGALLEGGVERVAEDRHDPVDDVLAGVGLAQEPRLARVGLGHRAAGVHAHRDRVVQVVVRRSPSRGTRSAPSP